MKKNKIFVKILTVATIALMVSACDPKEEPGQVVNPVPASNPTVTPSVDPTYEELPDEMLESQTQCNRYDERYVITAEEAEDFIANVLPMCQSSLCIDMVSNVDMIQCDPGMLDNMATVYGVYTAMCERGIGDCAVSFDIYDYDGSIDAMVDDMVYSGFLDESERTIITENSFYYSGCYCVPAANMQMFFDEFYGEGVVNPNLWDDYNEAFASLSGYVITGTGIGDSSSIRYYSKATEVSGNVATVYCDKYMYYMDDEGELLSECEIMLYKDATGVHFYSVSQ